MTGSPLASREPFSFPRSDAHDLAEITARDYLGERLVLCQKQPRQRERGSVSVAATLPGAYSGMGGSLGASG